MPFVSGKNAPLLGLNSLSDALETDHAFLTAGGVFSDDFIDAYLELKSEEEIKPKKKKQKL